ncbi:putative monovalent cation/H+ antiporter subunit A [Biformimicrobium ophioploci]|uniref:Monovalent cation/H+ antiporter subunit A n=2 Tax=Biformimicrobium ophioploci TaxID=3036711 RepID=A0ABQ6LYC2_9GAMM|nr:putative monovalent cation/H+ antiporter subunit A [Microbulbifer sp. NKW57]
MAADDMDRPHSDAAGAGRFLGLVFPLLPAIPLLFLITQWGSVAEGNVKSVSFPWVPSLGIEFSFFLDGLNLLFALLISLIGVFVAIYAGAYLRGHPMLRRFFLYLALFMVGMLGLVLAADLITLFIFWELTTISSYLLIGFNHDKASARRCALQALLLTTMGGLCLLAGLILLGYTAGTFDLQEILARGDYVRGHSLYPAILVLILLGAFTKSAQFPFHFWLPNAMAAPTPVSAYLHSATMVKAGIYLMARLHPVLGTTPLWEWTLTIVGAITATLAAILAVRQTDLKLKLAYTTVVALGTITMFFGSDDSVAIAAAITFILVHSFYKASLFMVVGIIDHQTGTRELDRLGGLGKLMPVTWFCAGAAAISMAGFPPFLGFIGKELKYEGALAIATEPTLVAGAAIFANILMVTVAGTLALKPFIGRQRPKSDDIREAHWSLWIGPLVLSTLGLTFGLFTPLIAEGLVQPAVVTLLGEPKIVKLKLWHGVNVPLIMSILTFGLGVCAYLYQRPLRAFLAFLLSFFPTTADRIWDALLEGLKRLADVQTRWLQHGILRRYLRVIFLAATAALLLALIRQDNLSLSVAIPALNVKEWTAMLLVAAGAVMASSVSAPLAAVCALGALGVGVALLYLFFGAPDVAITQLLVETLFLVLIAATLHRLPLSYGRHATRFRRLDALIAIAAGVVVTITILAVIEQPFSSPSSDYFVANSMPEAFGRNIVNVILVDFRALDTFGEVVVVFTAALSAATLVGYTLRGRRR